MKTVLTKLLCQKNTSCISFETMFSTRMFSSIIKNKLFTPESFSSTFGYERSTMHRFLRMKNDTIVKRYAHFKAATLKEFGEKLEIEERKRTKLKDSEVRIKVHNCAVNVADTLICDGKYDSEPKLPFVPGYEFSGEVLELGSKVKDLYVGDKVIGLNKDSFSAMATECLSLERDLWKIPSDVPYHTAAALVDSYATVLIGARRANLREDDHVLVTVGAGGLGLAAVDLAANLFKAKVIGACDTEAKMSVLRERGAFTTINYAKEKVVKAVMEDTRGLGVHVVFDAVGGDTFKDCLQSVGPEGCIVVLGFSSRKIPEVLTSQLLPKSCALIGVSLTHYQRMASDTYRTSVQEVIDMYLDDFISPHVAKRFKLDDVNEAIEDVKERKSVGKIILDIS